MKFDETFLLVIFATLVSIVTSFSGDDRFIKKYAMMKVFESCFGPEVVKEVRKEMKIATAKCSGLMPAGVTTAMLTNKIGSQQSPVNKFSGINIVPQKGQPALVNNKYVPSLQAASDGVKSVAPTFDLNKLQQAILEGYNKHVSQQTLATYNSSPSASAAPSGSALPSPVAAPQFNAATNNIAQQYRPQVVASPQQIPQQYTVPQQPYNIPGVYQQPNYPMFYPNAPYQQQPQQPQPYYPTPVSNSLYYQQQQPTYFPYYPATQRASRDLDISGQLETLSGRMADKVRNVTCVMQELEYLDANLEPAYEKMVERINRLPVPEDLKKDMTDGVEFCKQFSMCVPDEGKDRLAREMVRPMFFFRCYKHKKLEACIMKDVRDRYSSEEMSEESLPSGVGAEMRSMKAKEKSLITEDAMATAIYEFLYGGESMDLDSTL